MIAIRESIPTESIIRAYMDEAVEQEDEVIIEDVEPKPELPINSQQTTIENMENNSGATNTEHTEEIKQEVPKP